MDSLVLMEQLIIEELEESYQLKKKMLEDKHLITLVKDVAQKCIEVYRGGNKILIAGNGGSAGDAQHIAAELSGKLNFDRPGIPAIALSTNTSALTAISNDYGYENVFRRLLQAYGVKGDLFIGISTSGNSMNIIHTLEECRKLGITSVGFTGISGGKIKEISEYCILVPSRNTQRIQECHILIGHIICSLIEKYLFDFDGSKWKQIL